MFKISVSFATEVEKKNRPSHGCFNRGLRTTKDLKRVTGHLSPPSSNVRDLKSLLLSWKTWMYPCSFKCLKSTFRQKDVLFTVFGFLEYIFFNFSMVVFRTKSNRCLLKTMAIFLNFVVKTAQIWLVLGGFFCVFSQSETICNLHSFLSQSELKYSILFWNTWGSCNL